MAEPNWVLQLIHQLPAAPCILAVQALDRAPAGSPACCIPEADRVTGRPGGPWPFHCSRSFQLAGTLQGVLARLVEQRLAAALEHCAACELIFSLQHDIHEAP